MADGQKTEQPTPRRRQKAREKGQVARSRELSGALALVAVVVCVGMHPLAWVEQWRDLLAKLLEAATTTDLNPQSAIINWTLWTIIRWTAPVMAAAWGISVAVMAGQGGIVFSPQALAPNFSKFNPVSNVGKLFSMQGVQNTLKSLIPMFVISYIAVATVASKWGMIIGMVQMSPRASIRFGLSIAYQISWKSGLVFVVWGGADHFLQKFNMTRQMRMTREEVREESKETEGNPQSKVRVKRIQRQMRRRLIIERIQHATVVITNPTHFAVALEYRPGEMEAPVVLGKGRDLIALRIREEASRHGVPIVENPPLAQALYKAVEPGQAIPPELYAAVAEILAFIFRAQARAAQAARPAPPQRTLKSGQNAPPEPGAGSR
ncbi:MAG: EscU/YscU/HrcU family type III secretion system export apparatus switch protein [Terriglobia bacterium]